MYHRALPHALISLSAAFCVLTKVAQDPPILRAAPPLPLRALIVGGGPDLQHNQVAIESNVRYVDRLLPAETQRRILFADGSLDSRTVLYTDKKDHDLYRKTQIAKLDGPARLENVRSEFSLLNKDLEQAPNRPVLLYFTGHGSPDDTPTYSNNRYDLWGDSELSVKELANSIQALPHPGPIVLVMVECFSGAFSNVLFEKGNPNGELSDKPVCGFFASVAQRMAAGCTPNVNEADYRDFTGYFFAALTGTDRLGRPVKGADYDHDGKVGMNEAFCYALLHDDSIDTPVCTSDAFLRRFVTVQETKVFEEKYSNVQKWAGPAQRAALDGLSAMLHYEGDDRLRRAYNDFGKIDMESESDDDVHLIRYVRLAKSVVLGHMLTTGTDEGLKKRFATLLAEESANPMKP